MAYIQPPSVPTNTAKPFPRNTPVLNAPPLVTSPQTLSFPPIDYTKTAAQTGFPESILPRGGNGRADMNSASQWMQRTNPNYIPPASMGQRVLTGSLQAANVAGIGVGGYFDYQSGIAQGESQFRSGSNAIAGMGGAYAGGIAGAQAGAAVGTAFGPVGTVVGGILGGIGGSIAGSTSAGWLSDRVLDLFKGAGSGPNPFGPTGNPFSPKDPFGNPRPQAPQPNAGSSQAPPPSGPGGMPTNPGGAKSLDPFATPPNKLLPWLPDFKFPRMPWDPAVPQKPNDPKKPGNPGNPGKPDPSKPKPAPNPGGYGQSGKEYFVTLSMKMKGGQTYILDYRVLGRFDLVTKFNSDGITGTITISTGGGPNGYTGGVGLASGNISIWEVNITKITPVLGGPDAGLAPRPDPGKGIPGIPVPPNNPGNPPQNNPQNPSGQPGLNPSQNPTSPGIAAPYMGGNQGGFVPGLYKNPNHTPPKNEGSPEKKNDSPATKPATAPERTPSARGEPTLNPAPSTNPAVNQPAVNTPQPWTNPFFAPSSLTNGGSQTISPEVNPGKLNAGELNKGELNTGDQTGNTKWNPQTKKYEPSFPGVTDPSQIKTPATAKEPTTTVGAPPKTIFQIPSQTIPFIPAIPAAAQIPKGAIPQPITTPDVPAPSTVCNYKPDATVSVGLAKYNPLTDTITYTPTLVSASNAAGFQHLAQETANMRKEVSGIHKVLEVDLYRSPTGKVVAPKAECEVLQGVMSVSPLAAVPLIKTLPQEMKVLAAMNHMYSGHHLLGRVQLPSNPMDTKAPTVSPLTTVGMMLSMYSNTIATVGLPSTMSTVNAKGQTVLTPFRNATDAIETINAHVQGLQTEISAVMEMLFKVLQNQEMAINMIHKETYKTDLLIKDTGCRTSEIAVKRPGVMTHGMKKPGSTAVFNWNTVFKGSDSYTSVPVWKGDLDKQQLGLKTNMEAQKANTSVYFPISGKGDLALPKLSKKGTKDKEWERYVKTINEGIEGGVYHGPGMPESKIEEIKGGVVKKIVTDTVSFIGEVKTTV